MVRTSKKGSRPVPHRAPRPGPRPHSPFSPNGRGYQPLCRPPLSPGSRDCRMPAVLPLPRSPGSRDRRAPAIGGASRSPQFHQHQKSRDHHSQQRYRMPRRAVSPRAPATTSTLRRGGAFMITKTFVPKKGSKSFVIMECPILASRQKPHAHRQAHPPRAARAVYGTRAARRVPERRQDRAEIWRARAKSLAVRPPAEWVLRVSVTLFHWMVTSGWWLALSAR